MPGSLLWICLIFVFLTGCSTSEDEANDGKSVATLGAKSPGAIVPGDSGGNDPSSAIQTADGLVALDDEVSSLAFSPNGTLLAVGMVAGEIQLWDTTTRTKQTDFPGASGTPQSMAFSPDGKTLAVSVGRGISLWDIAGRQLRSRLEGHTDTVNVVEFSQDSALLVSGSEDMTVRLWNPGSGETLQILKGHLNEIHGVAISPDGTQIASCSGDFLNSNPGEIMVWDAKTASQLKTIKTDQSNDVEYSPDGSLLLGTDGKGVSVWDTQSWEHQRRISIFEGFDYEYEQISVSPDGRLVAACGLSIDSIIADVKTGEIIKELPQMRDLVFAPTATVLAGGDRDTQLQFVNTSTLTKASPDSSTGTSAVADELIEPTVPIVATRMQQAIANNNMEMLHRVLDRHPDSVRWKLGQNGGTALHVAAWRGNKEAVKLLLERGAGTSHRNVEGHTPLEAARENGHTEIVEMLNK